jgi:Flp pilus assembly protein TadB
MSPLLLAAAGCGAALAGGVFMIAYALTAPAPGPDLDGRPLGGPPGWRRAWWQLRDLGRDVHGPRLHADDTAGQTGGGSGGAGAGVWAWRWPSALGGGLLVWLLSGWPVAGLIVAACVAGSPILAAAGRAGTRAIDRAEAIEEWTRRLADVLATGAGLEQAITVSVATVPAAVVSPVEALSSRVAARWPVETALRAFADDLDDPAGDLVTAALILATRRRGPGLASVLTGVADSLAEDVAMRRRVDAERAKPRTTARAVTVITLAVLGAVSLNTTYLRPYGTGLGQLVLAALSAAFAASLVWMHALGRGQRAPRLFTGPRPGTSTAEASTSTGQGSIR